VKKYYRTYKLRNGVDIGNDLSTFIELVGGQDAESDEINGVQINEILRINIPIFLTQNIEDIGIYTDLGFTSREINKK
jgi:hypothetical protein